MDISDFPADEVIKFLRGQAQQQTGWRGAAFGAAMGAATALVALSSSNRRIDPKAVATGAALGAAFGAIDHQQFRADH